MVTNLFTKTTYKAYLSSLIFSLLVVFFVQYCKNSGVFSFEMIPKGLLSWGMFVFVVLMVSFLESRYTYNNYGAIHLLAFPMVFLFFPHGSGLLISKFFVGIMIIYSKYIYSKIFFSEKSSKNLFDLSLVFSLLIIYNQAFVFFYLLPLSLLFHQRFRNTKHVVSFLLPVIFVPLFSIGVLNAVPKRIFEPFSSVLKLNIWDSQSQSNSEFFWFIVLIMAVLSTVIYRPKRYEKEASPERGLGFAYMSFWLYGSILIGFLGLHIGQGRWFLSFIPAAYFFGVFLEKIKSNFIKNAVIMFSLIATIVFKLVDFEIVSL